MSCGVYDPTRLITGACELKSRAHGSCSRSRGGVASARIRVLTLRGLIDASFTTWRRPPPAVDEGALPVQTIAVLFCITWTQQGVGYPYGCQSAIGRDGSAALV